MAYHMPHIILFILMGKNVPEYRQKPLDRESFLQNCTFRSNSHQWFFCNLYHHENEQSDEHL